MTAKKQPAIKTPVFDAEHEKAKQAFKAADTEKQIRAIGAIAILERRAAELKNMELSGGDVVQIRARLSRKGMAECYTLFQTIAEKKDSDDAAVEAASNKLIGQILVVPGMQPADIVTWLEQNPESISDEDAGAILIGFGQLLIDEKAREEAMVPFRAE